MCGEKERVKPIIEELFEMDQRAAVYKQMKADGVIVVEDERRGENEQGWIMCGDLEWDDGSVVPEAGVGDASEPGQQEEDARVGAG
jgi:hypothetical protein